MKHPSIPIALNFQLVLQNTALSIVKKMSACIVFQSIVYDNNGKTIDTDDGILCQVIDNGEVKVIPIKRHSLLEAGIIAAEDFDPQLKMTSLAEPADDLEATSLAESPLATDMNKDLEWGSEDSKLLLDKYEQYLGEVGPLKRFRNKKCLWAQISTDILNTLHILRTGDQCANRYKTILKRKTNTQCKNRTSGATRQEVTFEDEINKIKAIDDSLDPEVLRGVNKVVHKQHLNAKIDGPRKKPKPSVTETLLKIAEEKEKSRERRHQEKLDLLRELYKKKE